MMHHQTTILFILSSVWFAAVSAFVELPTPMTNLAQSKCSESSSSSISAAYTPFLPNFCSDCGSANMELRIPDGDDHLRAMCKDCDAIVYANPKVVVACVVLTPDDKVLLAQRAIEPRAGYWGIPQGYMELDETTRQAICREVREETGAIITEEKLRFRALYNVPGSVQLVYSMTIPEEDLKILDTTTESTAVGFFPLDSLPDLCFPTVQWALDHCRSASQEIQQKNKLYNAATGEWSESEDKDGPI